MRHPKGTTALDFSQKKVLVTGSTSGIGAATALAFAGAGADVMITGRDTARGEAARAEAERARTRVAFMAADLGEPSACEILVAETHATLGGLDVLVNNAGVSYRFGALETSDEHWQAALDINVNAVCPGGVDTPMLAAVADWLEPHIGVDSGEILGGMKVAQLGRKIQPIEVGRVVAFLLSDHATIIRGQSISIDGGDTAY